MDSQFNGNWVKPGDSIYAMVRILYDTATLPFYPKMLTLVCQGIDSAQQRTRKELEVVLFFTPWNTLEVWDKYDYIELPRKWDQPDSGVAEPTRVYIPKGAVPLATALPFDSLDSTYDFEMQYVEHVSDLAFGVLMKSNPLDTVVVRRYRDSLEYQRQLDLRGIFNAHFEGWVQGRIKFDKIDDYGDPKTCVLSGVHVRLIYYEAGIGKSYAGGAITDANGQYNIHFDFSSWSNGISGLVKLDLELESDNSDFNISVMRKKNNRSKHYTITETIGLFNNDNNGSNVQHNFTLSEPDKAPFQALHYTVNAYRFVRLTNKISDMTIGLDIYLYTKDNWRYKISQISSHYFDKCIYIEPGDDKRESVVYHEFGHHVMNVLQGGYPLSGAVLSHPWPDDRAPRQAWCEGWGYGFAQIVDLAYRDEDSESDWILSIPDGVVDRHGNPISPKNANCELRRQNVFSNGTLGYMGEYFIACALYDLYDGADKFSTGSGTNPDLYNDNDQLSNGYSQDDDDISLSLEQIVGFFAAVKNNEYNQGSTIAHYYSWLCKNLGEQGRYCVIPKLRVVFRENRICDAIGANYFDHVISSDEIAALTHTYTSSTISGTTVTDILRADITELSNQSISLITDGNFTDTKAITDDLIIKDNGNLHLNNRQNSTGTLLYIPIYSCKFEIDDDGTLQIGDEIGYPSAAEASIYNKVVFKSGSTLFITNGSKLVVKKGGILRIEENVHIELNGDDAMIIIEDGGLLQIGDNATFTFTGSGRIKFIKNISYDANNNMIYPPNIISGTNSKFVLQGNGNTDLVLEVLGGEYVMPDNNLTKFIITDGQVNLDDNCRIAVGVPLYIENVKITSSYSSNPMNHMHRGLQVFGQADITIKGLTVKYGKTGLYAPLYFGGNKLNIEYMKVEDCITGVYTKGAGVNIEQLEMYNCKTGWQADETTFDSWLQNGVGYSNVNNSNGVIFNSYGSSSLRVYEANLHHFKNDGMQYYHGPSLSVLCSKIKSNQANGITFNGRTLNLSPGTSKFAGNNDLAYNNEHALNIYNCENLLLNGGKNSLYSSSSSPHTAIKAYTSSYFFWNDITSTVLVSPIPANNNNWDDGGTTVADIPTSNHSIEVDIQPNVSFSGINYTPYISVQDAAPFTGDPGDNCSPHIWNNNPLMVVRNPYNIININTTNFPNTPIHIAINQALAHMYVDSNYIVAISELSEILLFQYPTTILGELDANTQIQTTDENSNTVPPTYITPTSMSYENNEFLKLAYSKMMEALGMGIASGQIEITRGSSMPSILSTIINTIQDRISDVGTASETYKDRLNYSFDEAFIYRVAEDRTTAISKLNNMNWVDSFNGLWRDYYICSFSKEDSSIIDSIPFAALYDKFLTCVKPTIIDTSMDTSNSALSPAFFSLKSDSKNSNIIIYPNPTNSLITIKNINQEDIDNMIIYNIYGKLMTEYKALGSNQTIDIKEFSNGIYIIIIQSEGKEYIEKFIKE